MKCLRIANSFLSFSYQEKFKISKQEAVYGKEGWVIVNVKKNYVSM